MPNLLSSRKRGYDSDRYTVPYLRHLGRTCVLRQARLGRIRLRTENQSSCYIYMINARETLAVWASAFGSAFALLGVAESQSWLALLGITCSAGSVATTQISKRNRRLAHFALSSGEALNLDSLLIANSRRRLNRTLMLERAIQVAIIDGADLNLAWQYDGYCRSQREASIEFSIDSENNVPFEQLECLAFDLQNDPARLHEIRPTLVGGDGVSKKISVSFLQPLALRQRFSVLLNCKLPGCITTGVQYYTSSLSFEQRSIASASVHLIFVKRRPEWVRVYEYRKSGAMALVNELRPFRDDGATCEYVDTIQNVPGQSVRVYLYTLSAVGTGAVGRTPQFRTR